MLSVSGTKMSKKSSFLLFGKIMTKKYVISH